jgi:hypothetical protein
LTASCQKELERQQVKSTPTPEHAKDFELRAYQELGELSGSERRKMFARYESQVMAKSKTLQSDPELSEAFTSLEGIVNSAFYEAYEDFEIIDQIEGQIKLDFYATDTGNFVATQDYQQAYMSLYNTVNAAVDFQNGEDMLLMDLAVDSLNHSNSTATISYNGVIANLADQWFTPGEGYWAAVNAGPCSTPSSPSIQGTDAATFMKAYANNTAPYQSRCNNGVKYLNPTGNNTTNWGKFDPRGNDYVDSQWPSIVSIPWSANSNQCLGQNNAAWQSLYADMDVIIDYGLAIAQQTNPQIEFHLTNYRSYDRLANPFSGLNGNNAYHTDRYFHGGSFYYAIITCK